MGIGVLCLAVGAVAYNPRFYSRQFSRGNTSENVNLSKDELKQISDGWIAYFSGRSSDLQIQISGKDFYDEDELSHMKDARAIFLAVRTIGFVTLGIGIIGLSAILVFRKDRRKLFSFGAIWGSSVLLLLAAVIGIIMAINFTRAFEIFHEIFFPQGNWQFNTLMTQILTERLFLNAALYILAIGGTFTVGLLMSGLTTSFVYRRKSRPQSNPQYPHS